MSLLTSIAAAPESSEETPFYFVDVADRPEPFSAWIGHAPTPEGISQERREALLAEIREEFNGIIDSALSCFNRHRKDQR